MQVVIEAKDCTGARRRKVSLAAESTVGQVRPQLVEALGLADEEFDGQPIAWTLVNETREVSPVLSDTDEVKSVLTHGDVVLVLPTMVAGRNGHD